MSESVLMTETLWQTVATTLLHFLWQGLVVAGVLWLALRLLPKMPAEDRYSLCLVALLVMLACPVVTFFQHEREIASRAALVPEVALEEAEPIVFTGPHSDEFVSLLGPLDESNFDLDASASNFESDAEPEFDGVAPVVASNQDTAKSARTYHWWVVVLWGAGVALLSIRLCLAYVSTFLVRWGRGPIEGALAQRIGRLAGCVGLRRVPRVCVSSRVRQAIVVGYLRPMVLLPVSWVMQLPTDVLDAVIAHELAHIRRFDLWVILLQRVTETLLFYHPAVWWLSRRLSREREFCCDARAAEAVGSTSEYAAALEQVARQQSAGRTPALLPTIGGRKMELLERIERVMAADCSQRRRGPRWGGVGVGVVLLGVAVVVGGRFVAAGDVAETVETSSESSVDGQDDVANEIESDDVQPAGDDTKAKPLVQLSQIKGVIPDDFVVARVNGEEILMERIRLEGDMYFPLSRFSQVPLISRWLMVHKTYVLMNEPNLEPAEIRWRQEEHLRRCLALTIERILFVQHVRKEYPKQRSWELIERQLDAAFEQKTREIQGWLDIKPSRTVRRADQREQLNAELMKRKTSLEQIRQGFDDERIAALGIDGAWLELSDTSRMEAYLAEARKLAAEAEIETALDDWDERPRGAVREWDDHASVKRDATGATLRPVVLSEVEGPLTGEHVAAVVGDDVIGADIIYYIYTEELETAWQTLPRDEYRVLQERKLKPLLPTFVGWKLLAKWLQERHPEGEQWLFADGLVHGIYERHVGILLEELNLENEGELQAALARRGTSLERLRDYHRFQQYAHTASQLLSGRRDETGSGGALGKVLSELRGKTKIETMFDDPEPARANEEEKQEKDVDATQTAGSVVSPAPEDETPDELPSIEIDFDEQGSLFAGDNPGGSALKRRVAFAYGEGDRKAIAGVEALGGRVDPLVSTKSTVVDRDGVKKVRVVVSEIRFNVTLGDAKNGQTGGGLTAEVVEVLKELDHPVRLFLEGKRTTDADLARVRELPRVFGISVGQSHVTDAGFAELAQAKQLSEVQWFGACTDAGPAALAKLPNLRMLHVWGGALTAEGVRTISGFPKLTNLYLMGEPVTSQGFEAVLSIQRLEVLGLTAKLTVKELEGLSKLKALKRLAYFGTREEGGHLGEPEIRALAGLKQLRTLSVGMCRVRREFIEELRTANHLQSADLQHCRFVDVVGKAGASKIVRLLPVLKPVPVPVASPTAAETGREGKLDVSIEAMPVVPAGFEEEAEEEAPAPVEEKRDSAKSSSGSGEGKTGLSNPGLKRHRLSSPQTRGERSCTGRGRASRL